MKIVRVDCYNGLALCMGIVDGITGAASLVCVHIINSQDNICMIHKIAIANIITVLAILFLRQKNITAPIQQGMIPCLLLRCPFLILGGEGDNAMQLNFWMLLHEREDSFSRPKVNAQRTAGIEVRHTLAVQEVDLLCQHLFQLDAGRVRFVMFERKTSGSMSGKSASHRLRIALFFD